MVPVYIYHGYNCTTVSDALCNSLLRVRYGQIHVGDQILKVDGESLLGVTHEQAAMVIKTAMASNSHTLNLLLAQIPYGRFI